MISRTVTALLSVGLAGLVGCASGPRLVWNKPGASQPEFAQDRYTCEQANTESYSYYSSYLEYGESGTRINAQRFRNCTEAHGWQLVSQPPGGSGQADLPTARIQADTKAGAQKALSEMDQLAPKPFSCDVGWASAPPIQSIASRSAGYVVEVADWAETAGLRLGDKITEIGGTPVMSSQELTEALARLPAGGPLVLGVTRQGQPVALSLPCRYQPERFAAARRALEAVSLGDWDGCVAAVQEFRRLSGYGYSGTTAWEHDCTRSMNPMAGSPEWRNLINLHYEWAGLLLRESRYVPGGTEAVRGIVLRFADDLRKANFPAYANDLEAQLNEALAAPPVEPPASVPPPVPK